MVEQALHDVLSEMAKVFAGMQEENRSLKEKVVYFEGFKERLETDNLDLQEQLEKLRNPPAETEAQPEKKGRK